MRLVIQILSVLLVLGCTKALAAGGVVTSPTGEAPDPMLDAYMKEHNLEKIDWRSKMYEIMEKK